MEKRKWLWKRKSSERSPGETESSGSLSSHSERYSDEQVRLKESPDVLSPEVTSKATLSNDDFNDKLENLTEKLSAALVNVSAKDDLVKQHAKVAEEAVAGWEKAENELALLKPQLEASVQQNIALEIRLSRLDGALKECVRQLRQAKDEQEHRIHEAVVEKTCEVESAKAELESQLVELRAHSEAAKANTSGIVDQNFLDKIESLQTENSVLKLELLSRSEELEIRTMERDLSTQVAETASKQQLESIKKVVRLEAECRRLEAVARRSSFVNDHKFHVASSISVDSLTDSLSDSGERFNAVETDSHRLEQHECEPTCSDAWPSALIAELDQFKNKKTVNRTLASCSADIGIMDDFLEMERLASLHEAGNKSGSPKQEAVANKSSNAEEHFRAEINTMLQQMAEMEQKLKKIEVENTSLRNTLNMSQEALTKSQNQLGEAEMRLEELQKDLAIVNESKESLELQLVGMEVESRTIAAQIVSLKAEIEKERHLSAEISLKYEELVGEIARKEQEAELQKIAAANAEVKIKQEDLAIAADRLAECQKTIASLGRQLKSLATLEDFLIDTANLPGVSKEPQMSSADAELWKLQCDKSVPTRVSDPSRKSVGNPGSYANGVDEQLPDSSTASSANRDTAAKMRNGFGKLFLRSKSGILLENHQG